MKKMMKKAVSLLAAGCLVFSLAGCSNSGASAEGTKETKETKEETKLDAKQLYQEAVKKNSELTAMDMSMNMDMSMKMNDESIDMSMQSTLKANNLGKEGMTMEMTSNVSTMGQDTNANIYYGDGYYYIDSADTKVKCALDLDKIMEQVQSTTEVTDMDVNSFKEITVKEDGDNKVFTYKGDPEQMQELVDESMSQLTKSLEANGAELEMKINDISGEVTVNKDGYITVQTMNLDCSMSSEGDTMDVTMKMDAAINNPGGGEVTVNLPAAEEYIEMDASALGLA